MPHNTLFIKVDQSPTDFKPTKTKVGLMVRYDTRGISGPVELGAEQILATLDIDGVVITYPDGSQAVWPPKDSRWRLDE